MFSEIFQMQYIIAIDVLEHQSCQVLFVYILTTANTSHNGKVCTSFIDRTLIGTNQFSTYAIHLSPSFFLSFSKCVVHIESTRLSWKIITSLSRTLIINIHSLLLLCLKCEVWLYIQKTNICSIQLQRNWKYQSVEQFNAG